MKDGRVSASIRTAVIAVERAGAIVTDARMVLCRVKLPKVKRFHSLHQGIPVERIKVQEL